MVKIIQQGDTLGQTDLLYSKHATVTVDRFWCLSNPLSYIADVTNKKILVAYVLSKLVMFVVTGLAFFFGLTSSNCDGSLVDVVCRLMG